MIYIYVRDINNTSNTNHNSTSNIVPYPIINNNNINNNRTHVVTNTEMNIQGNSTLITTIQSYPVLVPDNLKLIQRDTILNVQQLLSDV